MADYLVGMADGRVGDAHDTGFFSASKRPICLHRARRVTNCVEDVCFSVLYAGANGWYKSDKKYLYAGPSPQCKQIGYKQTSLVVPLGLGEVP
jgi:hypothetical protein